MTTSSTPAPEPQRNQEEKEPCFADFTQCGEEFGRECWKAFLDDFSQVFAQVPVSVEVRGTAVGDYWLVKCAPLMGVSVGEPEVKTIDVILGDETTEAITTHIIPVATRHQIATPSRVWRRCDEQDHEVLQITDEEGVTTVITVLGAPLDQCPET